MWFGLFNPFVFMTDGEMALECTNWPRSTKD